MQGVVLVGTTASGKSEIAFAAAQRCPGTEIVSVDSMSVYRGLDIATAKPSAQQRAAVPHHLLDLVDPAEEFTVSMFKDLACRVLRDIESRHRRPLLVGGTGLYVRAVVDNLALPGRWPKVAASLEAQADQDGGLGSLYDQLRVLDPVAASRMTEQNRRRIVRALEVTIGSGRPFSSFGPGLESYRPAPFDLIGIPFHAALVDQRIEDRFRHWMSQGLLEEVRALAQCPAGLSRTASQALGYRELLEYVSGGVSLAQAVDRAIQRTRAFARRQWAWFRRDPRIYWIPPDADPTEELRTRLLALERLAEPPAVRE